MAVEKKANGLSGIKGLVRMFESHLGEPPEDPQAARRRIIEHVSAQQQQQQQSQSEGPSTPQME